MYRYLLLVHSDKGVVINAHLAEHQTDIEQEVETVEETPNKTPLLFIRLDFLLLSSYGLVFDCNGILQEYNFLIDFSFLLFCKELLMLHIPFQLSDTLLRLVKSRITKERVECILYLKFSCLLLQIPYLFDELGFFCLFLFRLLEYLLIILHIGAVLGFRFVYTSLSNLKGFICSAYVVWYSSSFFGLSTSSARRSPMGGYFNIKHD